MKKIHDSIDTVGALKKSGWNSVSVKEEVRNNLIKKFQNGEPLFPGIKGYENTVIPQLQHALLAKHDIILLGLRGQAKTKILRQLYLLLDQYLPVRKDTETNDNPFNPVSKRGKRLIKEHGDKAPVSWLHRSERYGEKLATPDTAVSDLIGILILLKQQLKR
nr:hypothetical protein [Fodinibius halophilus]